MKLEFKDDKEITESIKTLYSSILENEELLNDLKLEEIEYDDIFILTCSRLNNFVKVTIKQAINLFSDLNLDLKEEIETKYKKEKLEDENSKFYLNFVDSFDLISLYEADNFMREIRAFYNFVVEMIDEKGN